MDDLVNLFTVSDAARRLGVSRQDVSYAIGRDGIEPVGRAGLVRLFSIDQWTEVVKAVRLLEARRRTRK